MKFADCKAFIPFLLGALVLGSTAELTAQDSSLAQPQTAAPSLAAPASPPQWAPEWAPGAAPQAPMKALKPPPLPATQPPTNALPAPLPTQLSLAVDQLIARAEAEYARGQANYAAGHLEAAKDNFDAAFNLLLAGPASLQSDERLQAEFDKIVEGTHQLELQALKVGDGFTEQRAEPAPIDEANSITFPVDPSIKAKAQAELANTHSDLPLMLTDPVASYINYFSTRGHGTIERALMRRGRYADMISRIFREEQVPQDLMFLAQAESGFQPLALSRMGARGMWQFMPWDGMHAGLQRNWWIDERQDPEKATRAAARLLKDLYFQFGDWYLAMAAYNSGPGTVQRAVQRTGYADFWELYRRNVLPQETRNYVPIILAMTIMAKNPSQYGLDQLRADPPMASDTVRIHYPIDLRLVAECADSSIEVLQELNPSLLRMTTPKDIDFDLHLPAGTAAKFQAAVQAVPEEMRVYWRYHRVEDGDTLSTVARRYHTSPDAIAAANDLEGDDLVTDSKLIIPVSPARSSGESAVRTSAARSSHTVRYKARKGDTVLSVAEDFGVPAAKLRQWNHLKGSVVPVGRSLTIYSSEATASRSTAERSTGGRRKTSARAQKSKPRRGARTAPEVAAKSAKKHPAAPAHKREKTKDAATTEPARAKRHGQQS